MTPPTPPLRPLFKSRPKGFLGNDQIDHNSDIFDYIRELHEILWRVCWAVNPGATGYLEHNVGSAIEILERPQSSSGAAVEAMIADLRTLAACVISLCDDLGGANLVQLTDKKNAPAITLAQGILERGE